MKNDVNVASKSNKQNNLDPDPYQNVTDPQHGLKEQVNETIFVMVETFKYGACRFSLLLRGRISKHESASIKKRVLQIRRSIQDIDLLLKRGIGREELPDNAVYLVQCEGDVGEGHFVLFYGEAQLECSVDVPQTRFQHSTQEKRQHNYCGRQIADIFT